MKKSLQPLGLYLGGGGGGGNWKKLNHALKFDIWGFNFPPEILNAEIRGTQRQFSENICSEDDLRSRILGTFVVKFLAY